MLECASGKPSDEADQDIDPTVRPNVVRDHLAIEIRLYIAIAGFFDSYLVRTTLAPHWRAASHW
jgi:hypothetical protein